MKSVADLIWEKLHDLGVSHAVGVAGTQTVLLLEALRKSSVRYIASNTELAASFLAGGFYRASGRPAVLITIPGPGFTFALPGLAEARDDSAGMIYLLPVRQDDRPFASQQLPHQQIGELLAKQVLEIKEACDVVSILNEAWQYSTGGEPGPVIVLIPVDILTETAPVSASRTDHTARAESDDSGLRTLSVAVADRLKRARKPLLIIGQGAASATTAIRAMLTIRKWPVVTTTSGRGVIPESNPLVLPWECFVNDHLPVVQEAITESDLIISLGCKLSHNGSAGFQLELPPEKLVRVDTSEEVLNAGYPASIAICASTSSFLAVLDAELGSESLRNDWREDELKNWRTRLTQSRKKAARYQPTIKAGSKRVLMTDFFLQLRKIMEPKDIIVTDSGNHQNLARRLFVAEEPLTILCPIDYQSMGFSLPAAIGARLARPDNHVVSLMGDGGLCMCGLEILTAVRHHIDLTVIVFNDRRLSMIADRQANLSNPEFGVEVVPPDMELFARSVGANYVRLDSEWASQMELALRSTGVTLVEAILELPASLKRKSLLSNVLSEARSITGTFKKVLTNGSDT
jgi:acetolactate synthase-1/2/3 large subunit